MLGFIALIKLATIPRMSGGAPLRSWGTRPTFNYGFINRRRLVISFPIATNVKEELPAIASAENPLRAGMRLEPTAPPCAMVIFGASGDLTRRKLLPALYRLAQQRSFPASLRSWARPPTTQRRRIPCGDEGGNRGVWTDDSLDENAWQSFAKRIFYLQGDFTDAALYQTLRTKLEEIDKEFDTEGNRIFYLATAPDNFGLIAKQLDEAGIARPRSNKATGKANAGVKRSGSAKKPWTRIIVRSRLAGTWKARAR